MARLNVNFGDVPDDIIPVASGIYLCDINTAPEIKLTKKQDGSQNLIVQMVIADKVSVPEWNPKLINRKVTDYIYLSEMGYITVKKLAKAAGLTLGPDGLDTTELVGKRIKVSIKAGVNKESGKPSYEVDAYIPA
jgi:hypothetical protein